MTETKQHLHFQLNPTPKRRHGPIVLGIGVLIAAVAGSALWLAPGQRSPIRATTAHAASLSDSMTVYKSPTCDCCGKWIGELRNAGFKVTVVEQADIGPVKSRLNVPPAVVSCHTATIGGYVIEGHVPPEDIVRLLRERPAVAGIAVPGMPTGTPGMDGPKVPYTVVSFDRNGTLTKFAER